MEDTTSNQPRKRPRRRAAAAAAAAASRIDHNVKERLPFYVKSMLTKIWNDPQAKIIVFSGSGMSVSAGLPTFSGHLYTKASQTYKVKDGSKVFRYDFLKTNPRECFRFFKQLYEKATKAVPTPSHRALKVMEDSGKLVRHYTLNFDDLASASGISLWSRSNDDNDASSSGKTVELHGNICHLVCRQCGCVHGAHKNMKPIPKCKNKHCNGDLRFRVLMYDDMEGSLICNTNPLIHLLPKDVLECNAILWVGISFRQSASCQHFGTVFSALQTTATSQAQKKEQIPTFIIDLNPNGALENLMDGLQMQLGEDERVYAVESTSDEFFQGFVVP